MNKLNQEFITKLVFWLLVIDIPLSLILSFIIIAAECNNNTVAFFWNFDIVYLFSVFLGFLILYPFMFFALYLVTFIFIKITKRFVKE